MEIQYKNKKIEKICTNATEAQRKYNVKMAEKIFLRLDQIRYSRSIEQLVLEGVGRCHPLYGDRIGQYAMDLVHPFRLVFTKVEDTINIVEIMGIVDYH